MNLLGRNSITIFMIIAAIIITFGTTPLIKSDLVFAASVWKSGYDHGVSDASALLIRQSGIFYNQERVFNFIHQNLILDIWMDSVVLLVLIIQVMQIKQYLTVLEDLVQYHG